MDEQLQDDVPSIEIDEKIEPIDIEETSVAATDLDDPRAAIYAKAKERRQAEQEGTPVGTEPVHKEPEPAPSPAPDEMVTVKINGKEKRVSRAKVDEAGGLDIYQKRLAAEDNMRQAAEERRRVQEYEQQLVAKAQELQRYEQEIQKRATQQPASSPPSDGETKQMAREYHEAMLNGDLDRADELLIKLQGAQRQATPDADAIARKAAAEAKKAMDYERQQEALKAFEKERQEANELFEEEFADVAEDPELRDWANQKTAKLFKENPDWGPKKIISEAARQVREAIGKNVPAAEPSSKLEAKRSMTNVKGGSTRAAPRPVPKPPSRSQYVENLRKARGLE